MKLKYQQLAFEGRPGFRIEIIVIGLHGRRQIKNKGRLVFLALLFR